MTNREAVEILQRFQNPEPYEPQITEKAYEALQMAIDALECRDNGRVIVLGRDYWSRYYDIVEKEWYADGELVDRSFCIVRKGEGRKILDGD